MVWFSEAAPCFYAMKKENESLAQYDQTVQHIKATFFFSVPKGSDDTEWLWRCQAHPVNMLKRPTWNATDACSLSACDAQLNFTHFIFSATVTSLTKASERDAAKPKVPTPAGKWMSSGWATDGAGRRAGRKMCLPLKSPTAARHNTIRLEIVFPLPSPDWFLLSPGYSLSSASLLCIVIMQRTPRALTDHWYSLSVKWQRFKSAPLIQSLPTFVDGITLLRVVKGLWMDE